MSDTPRTDAEAFWPHDSQYKVCDAVFARQLEGELNAANTIIRQQQLLEEELNELRSDEARLLNLNGELERRIKRLEEAGDAMVSHAKALGMDGTGLVKRWSKAKEAKP